jgi:transposase
MANTREILRLRWEQSRSVRETAASLDVSTGVVSNTVKRAVAANLTWSEVQSLDDSALERLLYGARGPAEEPRAEPDCAWIHTELKRQAVTLELLHLEYLETHPGGYQYTAFCDRYRAWKKRRGLSMRQSHKAGEKIFVDFSGKKPRIVDPGTGEIRVVELFVAVLGASSYTYAEATLSQKLPEWISANIHALEFFGGVAEILVPDQLRSAVSDPDRTEPTIQKTYRELARHYSTVVIPARPRRPRDKAKVEVGVQVVQRWILARIRNETFFSLDALNERIHELLEDLNNRPMKHLGRVSRHELFERLERPVLKPLPSDRFEYAEWSFPRVNLDYHVQVDFHFYSVPHQLIGEKVEARATATTVEILYRRERIASHARSYVRYKHTTDPQHRPPNHQAWAETDPGGLIAWATRVGPSTLSLLNRILQSNPYRDQTWRSGRALKRVGEKYGDARTEIACERALRFGARSYKSVERMLKNELDRKPHPDDNEPENAPILHDQVRGPNYYLN